MIQSTCPAAVAALANLQFCDAMSDRFAEASLDAIVEQLGSDSTLLNFVRSVAQTDVFSRDISRAFDDAQALSGLSAFRMLRTSFSMPLGQFVQQMAIVIDAFDAVVGANWQRLADRLHRSDWGRCKTIDLFKQGRHQSEVECLEERLIIENPHAIYPTSAYRDSGGHVVHRDDFQEVDAVMTSRTFTTVKIIEDVFHPEQRVLRDVYRPIGRCVCVVDANVERYFGDRLDNYFAENDIQVEKLVVRAMEVDKGIQTVERMLGEFKRLGVSRNEPVLVVGGGVLSDTAGLACALYHRSTPYIMLSTSLVAGIDAGPSPRTCCDGFGYKNLFGAYHTPILSLTDRSMFRTLRAGWLRHGIAEIIKMATVKDSLLFDDLELGGRELIETRFGVLNTTPDSDISQLSSRILGRAIQSYVESEYGNLYETHQCRPHAYGHTWSPGFEIPAGLLHGHAVSIGMGFGAFLSFSRGWIDEEQCVRVMQLISSFDLSLWHDILEDRDAIWNAQLKMTEKRGGNLAAPLPRGEIGACGYLNDLGRSELNSVVDQYRRFCQDFDRNGIGIEPRCADVGLEDPSTVGRSAVAVSHC